MSLTEPRFNYITKSKILQWNRCSKLFFYNLTHKIPNDHKFPEPIYGLENDRIKQMAKEYFPGGVQIFLKEDVLLTHEASMEAILSNAIIYNPTFLWKDCIGSPDFLIPEGKGRYTLWELSTSINTKRDLETEMAFYKYMMEKLNIEISSYKVLKINPKYSLQDTLDIHSFFVELNFSKQVNAKMNQLLDTLETLRKIKSSLSTPDLSPEEALSNQDLTPKNCNSFKSCSLPDHCFPHLGEGNIFTLRESSEVAKSLYEQGVYNLSEIPEDAELTDKQKIQVETEKNQRPHINTLQIKKFLDRIHYPVYYLDFETINPQIPIYNRSKPYQHIPFLFSLHKLNAPNDTEPEHYDYIQKDSEDPRPHILKKLSELILPNGTILCFNDFFEKRCIEESVQIYPEYREWFDQLRSHFLDSAIPFKNLDYYNPSQKGSASLKDILPAITESSHSHLDIQNGYAANLEYLKIIKNESSQSSESQIIFEQLREYCKMDSYALFLIQKELERIVETRSSL